MSEKIIIYIVAAIFALIPAIIWLSFLYKKEKGYKQLFLFIVSIFSILPVFGIYWLIDQFPQLDVIKFFQGLTSGPGGKYVVFVIFAALFEEIAKQIVVRVADKKYSIIQNINDSINFSLITALGFAFAENIFYFVTIYQSFSPQEIVVTILFRSIFTTAAHMIFSGFLGYYYGIAKFSIHITEHSKILGKKQLLTNLISKILGSSKIKSYKHLTIIKGIFIASVLHAIFNLLLHYQHILTVALFVAFGFTWLMLLRKKKSSQLILVTDKNEKRASTIAKNDEDVIIELLGMWFNEDRFVDVIHICERLLERDPDNKIVQLFKAKAADQLDDNSPHKKLLNMLFPAEKAQSIPHLIEQKKKYSEKSFQSDLK